MNRRNPFPSLIPPFNAERQLKSDLANSMWGDANDLLWRVDMSLHDPPSYSKAFLAKVYVDILMSIESSLKSLIVCLSKKEESPEDAYITARKQNHNIIKLYQQVEIRSKRRIKMLSKKDINIITKGITLNVSNRYKLITELMLLEEDWIDRELNQGAVSSILNFDFINDLRIVAFLLHEISHRAIEKYCAQKAMNGSNHIKFRQRKKTFYTHLKATRNL